MTGARTPLALRERAAAMRPLGQVVVASGAPRHVLVIARVALALVSSSLGCGGAQDMTIGVAAAPRPSSDEWPPPSPLPPDAVTVTNVLASSDGSQVRVRAYLVAVTVPCPVCNVGGRSMPREEVTGRTSRLRGPAPPGCLPCPDPAATISDDGPPASGSPSSAPLRAVAVAGGLQPRHVGHMFVLTGVFHANGANGPELEVTDVRALDGQ